MQTLEKTNAASRQISPFTLRLEDLVVTLIFDRFAELPDQSRKDIVSLMEGINPETPADDRSETFETIREILFPELIGDICFGRAGSVEETPETLKQHANHVGSTIRAKRKEKKLKQKDLAAKSGLPQSHISRLEAGVHSPSLKSLTKIAGALGVNVGDLDPSH